MEGTNDTENGGETEEGANLRTHNKQTKDVEKKNSTADPREMILLYMKKFDDQMTKMENVVEENMRKMGNMNNMIKENGHEIMEMGNRIKENGREINNMIMENVREALTSVTTDMRQRMNQGTESKTDEVKIISVPTPCQIKTSTDTVQCDKSEF
jgi:hypothetical protein